MKPKHKILVIDDDQQTGRTIKNYLTSLKFDVCYACNGALGLQKFVEFKPNLVLCENQMSPFDGVHIYNIIKETLGESRIPIIMMSNHFDLKEIRKILCMGAVDFILKPIVLEDLKCAVNNQLLKTHQSGNFGMNEFNVLYTLSPNGIFLIENNEITDANPSFLKMFEITKNDLKKLRIENFFSKESLNSVKEIIQGCLSGSGPNCLENVLIQTKSGILKEASISLGTCENHPASNPIVGLIIQQKRESPVYDGEQTFLEIVEMLKKDNIAISPGVVKKIGVVLRHHITNKDTHPCDLFSKRENEVLNLSLKGLPTKLIADKLFISYRTVEKYRSKLMEKTGSNNIIEVIHYAVRNKLVNMITF